MLDFLYFCLFLLYACFAAGCSTAIHKLGFLETNDYDEPMSIVMVSITLPIFVPIFATYKVTCWLCDELKKVLEEKV